MKDHDNRSARLRYTAIGALAALAAVGAIAGTAALAAKPSAGTGNQAIVAKGAATKTPPGTNNGATKTPAPPVPGTAHAPQPGSNRPFLTAVQRLVNDGAITPTEGQTVDREIQAGAIDPQTLSGFTQPQLQAVEQMLENTKRALAQSVH